MCGHSIARFSDNAAHDEQASKLEDMTLLLVNGIQTRTELHGFLDVCVAPNGTLRDVTHGINHLLTELRRERTDE